MLRRSIGPGAMSSQGAAGLEAWWRVAREGYLSPLEQVRAWALREAMLDLGHPRYGMLTRIAEKLAKQGGGPPTNEAVHQLLERVDDLSLIHI